DPDRAYREGWHVRVWDFLFCASFGVVVTSSVRIGGVLLVFSYLIVPALAGILLASRIGPRLAVGWTLGAGVSIVAMVASAVLDLPTGATVVCAFGLSLLALGLLARLRPRPLGAAALADAGPERACTTAPPELSSQPSCFSPAARTRRPRRNP